MKRAIAICFVLITGCAPVHVHSYFTRTLETSAPVNHTIELSVTTVPNISAIKGEFQWSVPGTAYEPGASGFVVQFRDVVRTNTISITNLTAEYSFEGGPLTSAAIPYTRWYGEVTMHKNIYYAYVIPSSELVDTSEGTSPKHMKLGQYEWIFNYIFNGNKVRSTSKVQYLHTSKWQIGTMGWKD